MPDYLRTLGVQRATAQLANGQARHLIAPFEPKPPYDAMHRRAGNQA